VEVQRRVVADTGIRHALLSDPELKLAQALGLPTFNMDQTDWYRRTVIVVEHGRIAWASYPVASASSASEAVAWISGLGEKVAGARNGG
jgi:peroxiredoxin